MSWDEEEEDYFFMTPPRAAGMSTSHSSVSSEVGSTASPFVGALDPAVLCRVLDQLGYVNAIGVLDNIYLFSYLRSAAITYEKCMYKKLSHLVSCLFPCVNTEFTSSSVVWSVAAVK